MTIVIDNKVENSSLIVMSDDGTGAGIRIPSVLIGKEAGKVILDYMKFNPNVDLKFAVSFLMPKK